MATVGKPLQFWTLDQTTWIAGHLGLWLILLGGLLCHGCASLPPGYGLPKTVSSALTHPEQTRLGQQFKAGSHQHSTNSGFRMIQVGADGFCIRMQMINAAERTLDVQYYIFRGDTSGRLLTDAVLRAAKRGVRVRVLVDDGETRAGDEQLNVFNAQPLIELRIFNPFAYRGHTTLFRSLEFMANASRLDYRMHNKLLVVDNAAALLGGRNIGDPFFQMNPESQFADDDVFAVGPIVQKLSASFDEYWHSDLAIPATALTDNSPAPDPANGQDQPTTSSDRLIYSKRAATGEPFNGILSGRLPLVWAAAQLLYDSPDRKQLTQGAENSLMERQLADAIKAVHTELLMVTPYLVPDGEGMQLFQSLRQRQVRVRILTNSLEAAVDESSMLLAHSGYRHYRIPLLEQGVELYEVRSLLGNVKGSGETARIARYGNYALHAKLFVFDRQKLFLGSMNFDQRSMHLNTEIGLIIDSPVLAEQLAARFAAMTHPANAYQLVLRPDGTADSPTLLWRTQEHGKAIDYTTEPSRSTWQKAKAGLLSLLPLDTEL